MGSREDKLKEEILLAVAISLGSLFFATVITLIVAKYYKQIRACCMGCFASEEGDNNNDNNEQLSGSGQRDKDGFVYSKMVETRGQLTALHPSIAPLFLAEQKNPFTIPGSYSSHPIQPELKRGNHDDEEHLSNTNSYSPSPSDTPSSVRRSTVSTVSLPANFSPYASRKMIKFRQESITISSDDEDNVGQGSDAKKLMSVDDLTTLRSLRPELYDISRGRTLGAGNLGKIQLSVQYEDKSRRKLNLFLNRIRKLQTRHGITGIYVSMVLLPEREGIFTSKQHCVASNPVFEEKFIFTSRPMNRDFESKTVLLLIHYTDRTLKDIIYGEARMPLLCREIYSQVPTDITLNIKAASMQSEFGDLLVQLIYTESGTLTATIKMIKVPSSMSLENMSALRIKSYIKKMGTRIGRKSAFVTSLTDHSQHLIQLQGECSFRISKDNFMDCDLVCAVIGKHKILGKKLNLGKVTIGHESKDETGTVHWRTILNSLGVAWSVWHPIYNA